MPATTFPFSWSRRAQTALLPGVLAMAILGFAWFHRDVPLWKFVVRVAIGTYFGMRALRWMAWARFPIHIGGVGVRYHDTEVPFAGATLVLSVPPAGLQVRTARLIARRTPDGREAHVGFDRSLAQFDDAVRLLLVHVPEVSVQLTSWRGKVESEARRDAVLAPYRSSLEEKLKRLGKGALRPKTPTGA